MDLMILVCVNFCNEILHSKERYETSIIIKTRHYDSPNISAGTIFENWSWNSKWVCLCLEKFTKDQVPWDKIWLERSPWCLVLNNFVHKTKLGRYSHLIFFKISSDFLRQFHSMNLTLSKCFISDRDTYRTIKRNCSQSWWNLEEDPISLDRAVNQLNKLYQIDFLWQL